MYAPACETTLSEPDDVVVCSLHPSNDYKTSVLSGLSPSNILEICSRAISFWQYQIHQENSFQHAVVRSINDKNAQMQKQLENVVREANGEISLLSSKVSELERDLELERRKIRDLQDTSRERDKEYQKLKAQHDKIKRKALLAPNTTGQDVSVGFGGSLSHVVDRQTLEDHQGKGSTSFGSNTVDLGAVIGGMEANGIQRTPIVNRTMGTPFAPQQNTAWAQPQGSARNQTNNRQHFGAAPDRHFRSNSASDRSSSANEVENMLMNSRPPARRTSDQGGWTTTGQRVRPTQQRVFAPAAKRMPSGFKPAR